MEYAARFVKLAARYEEDVLGMITTIGYPSETYTEYGERERLGGGICFIDEAAGARELAANTSRIEAWRRTEGYQLFQHVRKFSNCFSLWLMFLATGFQQIKVIQPHPRGGCHPSTLEVASFKKNA